MNENIIFLNLIKTHFLMSYNATSPHDKDAMIIVACHDAHN